MSEKNKVGLFFNNLSELLIFWAVVYALQISFLMLTWNCVIAKNFGYAKLDILSAWAILFIVKIISTQATIEP